MQAFIASMCKISGGLNEERRTWGTRENSWLIVFEEARQSVEVLQLPFDALV